MPSVTVIVPTFQEERFVGRCLDSLLAGDFDFAATGSEILVVDGRSTDRTRDVIARYAGTHAFVRLLDNPRRLQVYALNLALAEARGDYVVRCDAHAEYPPDYVRTLVEHHERGVGDNIGGRFVATPSEPTRAARAIAVVLNSRLGVGWSYRTIEGEAPREVETVPFGSWKRSMLVEMGGFDEDLQVAEDLDLNIRLRRAGRRVVVLPWLGIRYYARPDLRRLGAMAVQYAHGRNKINHKWGGVGTARQLGPPVLVMATLGSALAGLLVPPAFLVLLGLEGAYLAAVLVASIAHAVEQRDLGLVPWCVAAYHVVHWGYGIGYLRALVEILLLGQRGWVPENITR